MSPATSSSTCSNAPKETVMKMLTSVTRCRRAWITSAPLLLALLHSTFTMAQSCPDQVKIVDGTSIYDEGILLRPEDIPAGCTHMLVKAWGGGGALGRPTLSSFAPDSFRYGDGGGGGALIARMRLSDADRQHGFKIVVLSTLTDATLGGGAAWIYPGNVAVAEARQNVILLAGGGGGGGAGYDNSAGWEIHDDLDGDG